MLSAGPGTRPAHTQASTRLNRERYDRFAAKPEPPPRDKPQRPDAYLASLSDEVWWEAPRPLEIDLRAVGSAHKAPEPSKRRIKVPAHILAELGVQTSRPRPLMNVLAVDV